MPVLEDFGARILLAWKGDLSFSELINSAIELDAAGLPQLSAVLYQSWVTHNKSPYLHAAFFNLGVLLSNLGELTPAEASYRHAIDIAPSFMHPRLNLGLLFERQGKLDDAISEWQWIDRNSPRDDLNRQIVVFALNHLGRVLESKKQFADSLNYLSRSLALQPDQPDVLHHWVFSRQKQCAWPVYLPVEGVSLEAMQNATSALAMLSISDDPQSQFTAACRYVEKKLAVDLPKLSLNVGYSHKKIRIGYCSSDFCLHPVAMLTAQLFELHNRDEFEIFGFCWSPEDGSGLRQRVINSMDVFIRVHDLDDYAAAQLIRSHEIDILVDLQGQTSGARANILEYRPAAIQITYLGLPATTAIPSIDYVIADEFLIPQEQKRFYSEKPLYMPHVYQVSDRNRPVAAAPTRQSCGLPDIGFVFCSFNNSYKYTPEIFDVWMRLLHKLQGSVLWLLADNPWAKENLIQEAKIRGISSERLVFANRVSPENYLARYHCADLFLDTFPFNAGTTANDCLWMGCPLLTLTGRSFASRMAGALLTAAGLAELITYNLVDYEDMAIQLANDSARCLHLRERLSAVRDHGVLFDTPMFVRDFESLMKGLVHDLPQAHLYTSIR